VLGLTFKEDCPDLRNSRVIDVVRELEGYGLRVQVADPLADPEEARHEYGVTLTPLAQLRPAAALVAAVAHREYRALSAAQLAALCAPPPLVLDVKGAFDRAACAAAGIRLWRL
jgi:UDP-N-acetyl-D-galactosamine dehydrogenase